MTEADNTLSSDGDLKLIQAEKIFLEEFKLAEVNNCYIPNSIILHSRALKTYYEWPKGRSLKMSVLKRSFIKTGHTLTIAHNRCYFRPFTLDIDCMCKKRKNRKENLLEETQEQFSNPTLFFNTIQQSDNEIHTTLDIVYNIKKRAENLLSKISLDSKNLISFIWKDECGYHIYTNIMISFFTHHFILQQLTNDFQKEAVVIEIPDYMPLPYSTKYSDGRRIYKPIEDKTMNGIDNFFIFDDFKQQESTNYKRDPPQGYYECVNFIKTPIENTNNIILGNVVDTTGSTTYISILQSYIVSLYVPQLPNNVRQLTMKIDYIQNVFSKFLITHSELKENMLQNTIKLRNENLCRASISIASYEDSQEQNCNFECKSLDMYINASNPNIPYNNDLLSSFKDVFFHLTKLKEFISPDSTNRKTMRSYLKTKYFLEHNLFQNFIQYFNKKFYNETNNSNYHFFIRYASSHGEMHLQSCIVALHKVLYDLIVDDLNVFKNCILKPLFLPMINSDVSSDPDKNLFQSNDVVRHFIYQYTDHTRLEYNDCDYKTIIDHLAYLYKYNITPFHTLEEIIDIIMSAELNRSKKEFIDELKISKKNAKEVLTNFTEIFIKVALELQLFIHNKTAFIWYVRDDEGYYRRCGEKLVNELNFINSWLEDNVHLRFVAAALESKKVDFWPGWLFHMSQFTFSTNAGVFNSITGLYNAHTKFLRYDKRRLVSIWPDEKETTNFKPTLLLNIRVLQRSKSVAKIFRLMNDRFTDLFLHYNVLPALVQLPNIYDVDEIRIVKFFEILETHKNLESAYFISEYFPIDPAFVALLLYWQINGYVTANDVMCYETLKDKMFNSVNYSDNVQKWREKFEDFKKILTFEPMPESNDDIPYEEVEYDVPINDYDDDDDDDDDDSNSDIDVSNSLKNKLNEQLRQEKTCYQKVKVGPYMKSLLSIRFKGFNDIPPTRDEIFRYHILAILLIKCTNYKDLTTGCGVNILPKVSNQTIIYISKFFEQPKNIISTINVNNDINNTSNDTMDHNNSIDEIDSVDDYDEDCNIYEDDNCDIFGFDYRLNSKNVNNNKHNTFNETPYKENNFLLNSSCSTSSSSSSSETSFDKNIERAKKLLDIKTDLKSYKLSMDRAIGYVFGTKLLPYEYKLATVGIILGMAVCFKQENFQELLSSFSMLFVPYNINKKFILYYGKKKNTGKSFFCKMILHLTSPNCLSVYSLSSLVERSNATTTNNVIVLSEVNTLDMKILKAISGNDASASKIFFKQEYEMKDSQALLYGATNNIIRFVLDSKATCVDYVTVERMHAIHLDGKQIDQDSNIDSRFTMLTEGRFFKGIMSSEHPSEYANEICWLSYHNYLCTRNESMSVVLNDRCKDTVNYRHYIYTQNNDLYALLAQCGLIEMEDMFIPKNEFLTIVERFIESKQCIWSKRNNLTTFFNSFQQQYSLDLKDTTVVTVPNFQSAAFIAHVEFNMAVGFKIGKNITMDSLEYRITSSYGGCQQTNARIFFKKNNKNFLKKNPITDKLEYQNLYFVNTMFSYRKGNSSKNINNAEALIFDLPTIQRSNSTNCTSQNFNSSNNDSSNTFNSFNTISSSSNSTIIIESDNITESTYMDESNSDVSSNESVNGSNNSNKFLKKLKRNNLQPENNQNIDEAPFKKINVKNKIKYDKFQSDSHNSIVLNMVNNAITK